MVMHFSDYLVYLWLIPITLQILLPLVILCGWTIIKLPSLLFGSKDLMRSADAVYTS